MADRVAVMNHGEVILVEDKQTLMRKMGRRQLTLQLQSPLACIPPGLADRQLELSADGLQLVYTFDTSAETTGIASLLRQIRDQGIDFRDLQTSESSLEEIFVNLVGRHR